MTIVLEPLTAHKITVARLSVLTREIVGTQGAERDRLRAERREWYAERDRILARLQADGFGRMVHAR